MKFKVFIFCIITILLTGCGGRANYNQDYSQGGSSKKSLVKPKVLGWDINGYKVFDTNKEKLALNNKATSEKAILVEEAIICEEKDVLLSFVEKTHDSINNKTGADFVEIAKSRVSYYQKMSLLKAQQQYEEAKAQNLPMAQAARAMYGSAYYNAHVSPPSYSSVSEQDKEDSTLGETFLKYCSATKNPQSVNIIERKPISKITKIELLINNQPYQMWTMEEHLINPTAQVIQQPIVQPVNQTVVEDTMPSYEQTQQPQSEQSETDVRRCLALVDNTAIAKCVRGK